LSWSALILAASLAANPETKLGSAERCYFGAQLEKLVNHVRDGWKAKGIHCTLAAPPGKTQVPAADSCTWVSETAIASQGSYQPANMGWQLFLSCEQSGKTPFTAAVALSATAVIVPTTAVKVQGKDWVIRDVGGNTLMLASGRYQLIEPGKGFPKVTPPEHPPVLAVGLTAMVAAEEGPGKPVALEVLQLLDVAQVAAALREASAIPAPKTSLPPPELPKTYTPRLPEPPKEMPYVASNEPEARPVKIDVSGKEKDEHLGLVTRPVAPEEQAYFTTVAARAYQAVSTSLQNSDRKCNISEINLGREGVVQLSPDGFVSNDWEFGLSCSGLEPGARDTHVMVKLLRHASMGAPREKPEIHSLGSDAVIAKYDIPGGYVLAELFVGDVDTNLDAKPPSRPEFRPGLARLGAIELTLHLESKSGVDPVQFFSQLDLTPIRALLKNPPKPPASSRPLAHEGPVAKASRASVESEVYQAALAKQWSNRERVVISENLSTSKLGKTFASMAKVTMPDLLPSALADFDQVAATSSPFPKDFSWKVPVVRLSEAESNELFSSRQKSNGGKNGWELFRERYPNSSGIVTFSRVGLSQDQTQAVVAVSWAADYLAAAGQIWFLRKTEHGWEVTYQMELWIS
jgi:hypothetical protein